MFDAKAERFIPLHGCSNRVVQNLALLFSAIDRGTGKVSSEKVEATATEEAQSATSIMPVPYEETGIIKLSQRRYAQPDLVRRWGAELAELLIQTRRSLRFQRSSLILYNLWRTFDFECDEIEYYLPQPCANLPAMILEVVEIAGLVYHPESFKNLQNMALVQFYTGQKIWHLKEAWMHSWMQDLSPADLSQQVSGLMAVIRGKTVAEKWINVAAERDIVTAERDNVMAKRDQFQAASKAKPHQDLLPFAMWHIGRVSVDNISRLLLQSRSSIAESILDEVLQSTSRATFSQPALEDIARMTNDPPVWAERLKLMSKRARRVEIQPPRLAEKEVTGSKDPTKRSQSSSLVVSSSLASGESVQPEAADPPIHKMLDFSKRVDSPNDVRIRKTVGRYDCNQQAPRFQGSITIRPNLDTSTLSPDLPQLPTLPAAEPNSGVPKALERKSGKSGQRAPSISIPDSSSSALQRERAKRETDNPPNLLQRNKLGKTKRRGQRKRKRRAKSENEAAKKLAKCLKEKGWEGELDLAHREVI